jgi:hypothetical protein
MRSLQTYGWLSVALLTGCGQTVVLGSECPSEPAMCLLGSADLDATPLPDDAGTALPLDGWAATDAQSPLDAMEGLDGTLPGSGALDASLFSDAASDAASDASDAGSLAAFPMISNGSFEITRGGTGDIAFQPPGSPALGFTLIEPWQACRAGIQVLSTYPSDTGPAVTAEEGNNFVLDQFAFGNPAGLSQQLGEPLKRGVPYAFAISLRVARESEPASLNVYGVSVQCLVNATPLATSRIVTETTWQRVCIRFTPSFDQSAIMLGASANATARLLMDDLRYDPECAAL